MCARSCHRTLTMCSLSTKTWRRVLQRYPEPALKPKPCATCGLSSLILSGRSMTWTSPDGGVSCITATWMLACEEAPRAFCAVVRGLCQWPCRVLATTSTSLSKSTEARTVGTSTPPQRQSTPLSSVLSTPAFCFPACSPALLFLQRLWPDWPRSVSCPPCSRKAGAAANCCLSTKGRPWVRGAWRVLNPLERGFLKGPYGSVSQVKEALGSKPLFALGAS